MQYWKTKKNLGVLLHKKNSLFETKRLFEMKLVPNDYIISAVFSKFGYSVNSEQIGNSFNQQKHADKLHKETAVETRKQDKGNTEADKEDTDQEGGPPLYESEFFQCQ